MIIKKVLIVDDHDFILKGIEKALLQYKPDLEICLSKNCDDAFAQIKKAYNTNKNYDLLITDLSFENLRYSVNITSGEELIRSIRKLKIPIKIIIITRHNKTGKIVTIIDNYKPDGYILKSNTSCGEISQAIEDIENDTTFYSQEAHLKLRNRTMIDSKINFTDLAILKLIPKVETIEGMAGQILKPGGEPYSKRTIEIRLQNLRERLNANNNTDLHIKAQELGLVK
jgi:DNA-binding NarL/FixJ family response regulator